MIPTIAFSDGTALPQLGFGTCGAQPDRQSTPANVARTAEVVGLALRVGYRLIDTARSYGTERGVGEALAASGIPRGKLSATSKLGNGNHRLDECGAPSTRPSTTSASTTSNPTASSAESPTPRRHG